MSKRPTTASRRSIFAIPALIAAATLIALVCGLLGGGVWDVAAWAGLAIAALTPLAYAVRRRT